MAHKTWTLSTNEASKNISKEPSSSKGVDKGLAANTADILGAIKNLI